ncbi:MAG: MerR family transcriptional regulator [Spirochaetaceae bacterium]|jgi:DNA-binding transcriptional MerR regulator|nr:MerR family transcriptional regulator [Spirochaetaceae bacterium]
MNTFSSADLEKILNIKPHTIRYWQDEIPLIQPRKDGSGKFIYSKKDVEYLLRIKHLVVEKKHTLEGAREQLYNEQEHTIEENKFTLSELRGDLLDIYTINREQKKALKQGSRKD